MNTLGRTLVLIGILTSALGASATPIALRHANDKATAMSVPAPDTDNVMVGNMYRHGCTIYIDGTCWGHVNGLGGSITASVDAASTHAIYAVQDQTGQTYNTTVNVAFNNSFCYVYFNPGS
jgi:hypothetical protein